MALHVSVGSHDGRQRHVNVGTLERWPSAIGGGALLALAVRRTYIRAPLGIALLLVAGHLLYRGLTGHDRIYGLLGIDTSTEMSRGGDDASSGSGAHDESMNGEGI